MLIGAVKKNGFIYETPLKLSTTLSSTKKLEKTITQLQLRQIIFNEFFPPEVSITNAGLI